MPLRRTNHIEREFLAFHAARPDIYEWFHYFTMRVIGRGYKRHSARDIIHRIRWELRIERTERRFKINNNWSPYYARMWETANPQYRGFFEKRTLTARP